MIYLVILKYFYCTFTALKISMASLVLYIYDKNYGIKDVFVEYMNFTQSAYIYINLSIPKS